MTPKQTIYEVYLWLMHEESRLIDDKKIKGEFYRANPDNFHAATKFFIACKRLDYFKEFAEDVLTILRGCEDSGD